MNVSSKRVLFPRITKAYAKSLIVKERIVVDEELSVVSCIVKLVNGHRLTADAIVANKKAFDVKRGTDTARTKIINKIIELEMYVLRTNLHNQRGDEDAD